MYGDVIKRTLQREKKQNKFVHFFLSIVFKSEFNNHPHIKLQRLKYSRYDLVFEIHRMLLMKCTHSLTNYTRSFRKFKTLLLK